MSNEKEPTTFGELWPRLIYRLGVTFISPKTWTGTMLFLLVWGLGSTYLVPEPSRLEYVTGLNSTVENTAAELRKSDAAVIVPWVALAIVVLLSSGVVFAANARVQRQGRLLQECRDRLDPDRLSSRNPASMLNYAEAHDVDDADH